MRPRSARPARPSSASSVDLPAPGGADDGDGFAGGDLQVDFARMVSVPSGLLTFFVTLSALRTGCSSFVFVAATSLDRARWIGLALPLSVHAMRRRRPAGRSGRRR